MLQILLLIKKINFYDLILMFDVFEHVVDPLNYLKTFLKNEKIVYSFVICLISIQLVLTY